MKIIDIADEIFRDLDNDSSISAPSISLWIRGKVGDLNNLINTDYYIDTDSQIARDVITDGVTAKVSIGEEEKAIIKKMYLIHYYDFKVRKSLGAAGIDTAIEVTSDGSTVRMVNKNELGKSFLTAKKMEIDELKILVNGYKSGKSTPLQIAGDDTISAYPEVNRYRII